MGNSNLLKNNELIIPFIRHIFRNANQHGSCSVDWRSLALTVLTHTFCSAVSVLQCFLRASLELEVHLLQPFLLFFLLKLTTRPFFLCGMWVSAFFADLKFAHYCTNLN